MEMKPAPRTSVSAQRRSIALITFGFVLVSAVLHLMLGGSMRAPWSQKGEQQRVSVISIDRMPTPAPTPTPTPRETPRPMPSERPAQRAPAKIASQRHPRSVVLPVRKGAQRGGPVPPQISVEATPVAAAVTAPPAPEAEATPIDARDIIISARFVHRAEPDYPQLDIDRGVQGTVIVLVTIGPDGSASDIRVWQSSGDADLDRAALEAARLSTFAPPEVDGQPATQTYRIIYTFYLD